MACPEAQLIRLYHPNLSSEARIVALYLARRFEMTPEWHPREQDISECCGVSIYAARKALTDLRGAGFLTVWGPLLGCVAKADQEIGWLAWWAQLGSNQ